MTTTKRKTTTKKHKPREPSYVAATLKWCNARRKEHGKKPLAKMPKGRRMDPWNCPCGKTCQLTVGSAFWHFRNEPTMRGRPLPINVYKFVYDFDRGLLPQYEL